MSADDILLDVEERMEKAVAVFKSALLGIRTGRANAGLVDTLRVDAYGSPTPLKQLASVGVPEPNQILIRPFDPGTLSAIEKAIQSSELGLNPINDGRVVRLVIPALSGEVRQRMVSRTKELAEEAKVAIRNVRRDGNKTADQQQKAKVLTEDDRDSAKEEIQQFTKKYEAEVGKLAQAKETEVLDN